MTAISRNSRILILGAGAGGLSAAHYLRRYGYRNVTVFETLGRVGGLCRSITEDNQAFDLGAAVISPAYREIRRMARRVGAPLDRVEGAAAFRIDTVTDGHDHQAPYHRLLHYLAGGSSLSARWHFYWHCLRYLWKRFRMRRVFKRAGWAGIASHEELNVAFSQWLQDNGLQELTRLFEMPVTAFGYGDLDEIAAPYVLRYLSPASFLAVLLSGVPLLLACALPPAFATIPVWLSAILGEDRLGLERTSEHHDRVHRATRVCGHHGHLSTPHSNAWSCVDARHRSCLI